MKRYRDISGSSKEMKELYLANMWPQIVTQKGVALLEQHGFKTSGNWLNRSVNYAYADRIVLPYADFGRPILITEATPKLWKKVISYILFPDSVVGWDAENNRYLHEKNMDAEQVLSKSHKKLSHSNFSSRLVNEAYGIENITVPLGIDTDGIRGSIRDKHTGLRVLWNHMWRSDKGTYEAFDIISKLASKYPKIEFWIGQTNTWSDRDMVTFKQRCEPRLKDLQNLDNVRFFDRIKDQKEYWAWLSQVDISFSTAFQEGFGLSMMEQEAAGIACVVPDAEVYPELHAGCLIVNRSKLSQGLQFLIEDPDKRKFISQSCMDNASKHDTSAWVKSLINQFE